jgi:hypothetical protein
MNTLYPRVADATLPTSGQASHALHEIRGEYRRNL